MVKSLEQQIRDMDNTLRDDIVKKLSEILCHARNERKINNHAGYNLYNGMYTGAITMLNMAGLIDNEHAQDMVDISIYDMRFNKKLCKCKNTC